MRGRKTYKVPSTGAVRVSALVARELVDQDAGGASDVGGAAASGGRTACGGARAVALLCVLQGAGLRRQDISVVVQQTYGVAAPLRSNTYHVLPSARAGGVGALEAGPHVDEDTAVVVEVGWALAVASAAEARERDLLRDGLVRRARVSEDPPRVEDTEERREGEREREDRICILRVSRRCEEQGQEAEQYGQPGYGKEAGRHGVVDEVWYGSESTRSGVQDVNTPGT